MASARISLTVVEGVFEDAKANGEERARRSIPRIGMLRSVRGSCRKASEPASRRQICVSPIWGAVQAKCATVMSGMFPVPSLSRRCAW